MKRAKIMLMSIAVLVTVGSALAFKANKGQTPYCYIESDTPPAQGGCKSTITQATALFNGTHKYYYVERPTGVSCTNNNLVCEEQATSFTN